MLAIRIFSVCAIAATLSGCGVFAPEKGLLSSDDVAPGKQPPQGQFEANVVRHVECELSIGIWRAMQLPDAKMRLAWLRNYGAFVTLKLAVEDQSALAPSASFLTPLANMQSFTLGIGGSGTANATRTETIQFTFPDGYLYKEALANVVNGYECQDLQKGVLIDSDLKIGQFVYDKAFVAWTLVDPKKIAATAPFSQLQFEINFVASFGGSITPTWKFTRTSVNSSGTLFSATRTDTDDVLITLGPLNANTAALHNAALTGNSTGLAVQSLAH
jgi:hypothetical protein